MYMHTSISRYPKSVWKEKYKDGLFTEILRLYWKKQLENQQNAKLYGYDWYKHNCNFLVGLFVEILSLVLAGILPNCSAALEKSEGKEAENDPPEIKACTPWTKNLNKTVGWVLNWIILHLKLCR